MCYDFLYNLDWNLSQYKTKSDIVVNVQYIGIYGNYRLFYRILMKSIFLERFPKILKCNKDVSSLKQGIHLEKTDGQTDMKEHLVIFCNFAKETEEYMHK